MSAEPTFALDDDLMHELAYLRAAGRSWEDTAAELRVPPQALRRAARAHPEYRALAREAAEEVEAEAAAELVAALRDRLRSAEPPVAQAAADTLAKHLADAARERTRLKVERLRFAAARERAELQRERLDTRRAPVTPPPLPELRPEDVPNRPDVEPMVARLAQNRQATVWLWGGEHPIDGVEPDGTDIPLALFEDHTVRGRHLFWAVRSGLARGEGRPVPELTADQIREVSALGGTAARLPDEPGA